MAVCDVCNQDMTRHVGCIGSEIVRGGVVYQRRLCGAAGEPNRPGEPCHDCGCPVLTLHHAGCDAERCPRCDGQMLSCGCAYLPGTQLLAKLVIIVEGGVVQSVFSTSPDVQCDIVDHDAAEDHLEDDDPWVKHFYETMAKIDETGEYPYELLSGDKMREVDAN